MTSSSLASTPSVDTVVIGAGQAGLAAAYYLQRAGVDFVVLDEQPAVGQVWASRYDSLRLFSPAWVSSLPGLSWPGNPLRYPTKAETAAYLQQYAAYFNFPLHLQQRVEQVTAVAGGYDLLTAAGHRYRAQRVVVCTGPFSAPRIPDFAPDLASGIEQLHSSRYQRPTQLPGTGPVAVVGSGNSALQIAADLAATGRPVYACYQETTPALPNNTAMWAFLMGSGLLRTSRHSALGRRLLARPEPVVSADLARLRRFANVQFIGRARCVLDGNKLQGESGDSAPLQGVVWATGYRPDFGWLQVPVLGEDGLPRHHRGVSEAPGLAFLGLPWLNSRRSALMGGAGADARYVVEQLLKST
ncbi:NAD(P)/FAD-dependent oxidoreductase [Hymenobacter sp. BT175]|uniref:flavin-containing monooxygenase n=1 Tax=Hymenobacter translucens TaxID=2886507 RepID=UPI001D0EB259|nr:NAD(P)/FAD-dependent oxidoreductase [Hymenobacter translucens]MCC2547336.1 NAD(P)/FAD-dependent oxidoreductase [Hymenobacter translucens]